MSNLCYLNQKNPILSISLLTSNRKDTIRKCLDSITHLRQTVSSELVIVDTGCDEEMRSIIEEYTDRIVKFKWIQDFAAARNAGLFACKGKWFMYLDDDEWFEDTEDIEDFFVTNKYRLVKGCWYIQRNYMDMEGHRYTDDTVSRMLEIVPGLHFKGCIHEYLDPFDGEYTTVKSYVHHYGYIFKDDAERYKHLKRNLPLLYKMIDAEPDEMRWWLQIAQEYNSIKEYGKVIEVCEQGLEHFKNFNDRYSNRQLGSFYLSIVDACYFSYDYDNAVKNAKKALADKRISLMAKASIYEALCRTYAQSDNLSLAKESALKYFDIYEQLKDDQIALVEQSYYKIEETFAPRHMTSVFWIMIKEGMERKDVVQISEYFEKIDFSKPGLLLFDEYTLFDLIDFAAHEPFDLWYTKMFNYLACRQDLQPRIIAQLKQYEGISPDPEHSDSIRTLLSRYSFNDKAAFENIIRISSYNKVDNFYINYMKILSINVEESRSYEASEYVEFVQKGLSQDDEFLLYRKEYWDILEKIGVNIGAVLENLDYEYFAKCVDRLCEKTCREDEETLMELTRLNLSEEFKKGIRYKYYILRTTEEFFRRAYDLDDYSRLHDMLISFIDSQIAFYSEFYKDTIFTECPEILPKSCQAALVLNEALALEEDGKYSEALSRYKTAIGIHSPINDTIQHYAHLYADALKNNSASSEMDILSHQIKANAKGLIDSGDYTSALSVLNQLKQMLPNDSEIDELINLCNK